MAAPRVYLDYNAGAPLRPEARAAMIEALDRPGNASSVHGEGRAARSRIEAARRQVARLAGADPLRVVFTSGGTEANVTALSPRMRLGSSELALDRLLVGATEHPSVLSGGRFSPDAVEKIAVDGEGLIRLDDLRARLAGLAGKRALVSVMLANNETGAIQPIAEVVAIARSFGALVHCDAIQAAGRIPLDIGALGVDMLTLSAHKIGGPHGVGALVLGGDLVSPMPLLTGGGQERYGRAGTENIGAIAGFGAAAEQAAADLGKRDLWIRWRDRIAASAGAAVLSHGADRLPQTISLAVDGLAAETLVIAMDLDGIAISAGSACSSGKVAVSHVTAAMGLPAERAKAAVRISFGFATTEGDIERLIETWGRVAGRLARQAIRAA